MRTKLALSAFAATVLVSAAAAALPSEGALRPSGRVVDADDRALELATLPAKPVLVLYEDKESALVNAALKADLSRLARGDRYRSRVALVPVANVSAYDFWPARGFVKDAIARESRKIGAVIYCDWDGSFARAVGFAPNTSSVLLVGRDGRVLFAWEGAVPPQERARLLELLRNEVDPGAG